MTKALVFSPNFEGHRQVYCSAITSILLGLGFRVCLAGALDTGIRVIKYPLVERLRHRRNVELWNTAGYRGGGLGIELEELASLIEETGAHVVMLAEADNHIPLLARQRLPGNRRLPGHRVGIFVRSPSYVHAQDSRRARLTNARAWRNRIGRWRRLALSWQRDPVLFHELLLPRGNLLDSALCLDECFVESHGSPYSWMPDIFRTLPDDQGSSEDHETEGHFREFLRANERMPLVLYYGTAHFRRGYDLLLRLAVEEGGCFVHWGRRNGDLEARRDIRLFRGELAARQALFETDRYMNSFESARAVFSAARCVVLPYRAHLAASGVMLQALEAHTPVLVSERGLMGWRTRNYGLGSAYREDDWADLRHQFRHLLDRRPDAFDAQADDFLAHFSRGQVRAALAAAVGLGGPGASRPRTLPGLLPER